MTDQTGEEAAGEDGAHATPRADASPRNDVAGEGGFDSKAAVPKKSVEKAAPPRKSFEANDASDDTSAIRKSSSGKEFKEKVESGSRESGSSFTRGTLVWVHIKGFPWWPGIVVKESDVPQQQKKSVMAHKKPGHLLIFTLGDHMFTWSSPEQSLKTFVGKHAQEFIKRGGSSSEFTTALKEARAEESDAGYVIRRFCSPGDGDSEDSEPEVKSKKRKSESGGDAAAKKAKGSDGIEESVKEVPGFVLFCRHNKEKVMAANPNVNGKAVVSVMVEMWRKLPDEKKLKFERKAKGVKDSGGSSAGGHGGDGEEEPDSKNHDYCDKCGGTGELICCDGCPAAYHPMCVGIDDVDSLPDQWFCKKCRAMIARGECPAYVKDLSALGPAASAQAHEDAEASKSEASKPATTTPSAKAAPRRTVDSSSDSDEQSPRPPPPSKKRSSSGGGGGDGDDTDGGGDRKKNGKHAKEERPSTTPKKSADGDRSVPKASKSGGGSSSSSSLKESPAAGGTFKSSAASESKAAASKQADKAEAAAGKHGGPPADQAAAKKRPPEAEARKIPRKVLAPAGDTAGSSGGAGGGAAAAALNGLRGDKDSMGLFPPGSRVYIGSLASERTTERELREIFGRHGKIALAPMIKRGFAFVQYSTAEEAQRAIQAEQGTAIGGQRIHVRVAGEHRRERQGGGGDGDEPRERDRERERGGRDRDGPAAERAQASDR